VCLRHPSYFLFAWPKRKLTKEKGHPAWRLPPIHGRQVREPGPGFSNGHPARAKRNRRPVGSRYAACRPRLTAAQGAPGRAADRPGPHSVRPLRGQTYPTRVTTPSPNRIRSSWETMSNPICHPCVGIGMSDLADHPTMGAKRFLLPWPSAGPEIHGKRDHHR
jgi:hypothetical protein